MGRIEWRVNGTTAAVAARPEGGGPVHTVSRLLALDPGDNTIEVVAHNRSNLLASLPPRTTVKFTGPADKIKPKPKLHVLAIGINAYADQGWRPPGSKTRDSFILFAAAHGDAENGRFYLIPQDYQSGPPGTLKQRAIGQDDLQG